MKISPITSDDDKQKADPHTDQPAVMVMTCYQPHQPSQHQPQEGVTGWGHDTAATTTTTTVLRPLEVQQDVELPEGGPTPTPPVSRLRCLFCVVLIVLAILLPVVIIGCLDEDGWSCHPSTPPRDAVTAQAIVEYINSITLSGQIFVYDRDNNNKDAGTTSTTAEERAVRWLIEDDLHTELADKQSLRQRYVLATVWFELLSPNPDKPELSLLFGSWSKSWMDPHRHECEWKKVQCINDSNSGPVTDLRLSPLLSGTIPADLALLTALAGLELSGSNPGLSKTGTISSTLGLLTNLTYLKLTNNGLSGTIPSTLGLLTNLTYLQLTNTGFSGTIPSNLGQLTNLAYLLLTNYGLSGTIPSMLGLLTNLTHLQLTNNGFSGTIPSILGLLTNLTHLQLTNNGFSGTIPATTFGRLSALHSLQLDYNGLSGTIPSTLGPLTDLTCLRLDNNRLNGTIPSTTWGLLPDLKSLTMNNNKLSGTIPSTGWGMLTALTTLRLDNNELSGTLPSNLGQLTALSILTLSDNELTGTIPSSFEALLSDKFSELAIFLFFNNQLRGGSNDTVAQFCGNRTAKTTSMLVPDCDLVSCTCCTACGSDSSDEDVYRSYVLVDWFGLCN